MSNLLQDISQLSTVAIAAACAVHLLLFVILLIWSKRDLRQIVSSLDEFTRGLKHRSVLGLTGHLSDQIEAFIADINEVLEDASRSDDRQALLLRMNILDERRGYLHSLFFETVYNIWRTMIEAYPLAGVLGTILAIGVALQTDVDPAEVGAATSAVGRIVGQFGNAVWSTFAGLTSAILLMFLNSCVEPPFHRLSENRQHIREMTGRAKRELSLGIAAARTGNGTEPTNAQETGTQKTGASA